MSAGAFHLKALSLARHRHLAAALLLLEVSLAGAQPAIEGLPNEARYLGRLVPDVSLRTAAGDTTLQRQSSGQPLLLALVFSRCAGVCSPFLASLRSAQEVVGGRGASYRTLVVSFDPRDSLRDMDALAERLGLAQARDWSFGVADAAAVQRLAEAIGFWFAWDAERKQFDHPALLVGVREGRVARLLVANQVEAARLQEVVRELRGEFVPAYPLPGRVAFRCFEYDPASGRYLMGPGFLLLLLPATLAVLFTGALFARGASRRAAAADL